tara:strand:+ start:219 stop:365 length:147 start_codon:yes stop_codon:yes gene_type:complete
VAEQVDHQEVVHQEAPTVKARQVFLADEAVTQDHVHIQEQVEVVVEPH